MLDVSRNRFDRKGEIVMVTIHLKDGKEKQFESNEIIIVILAPDIKMSLYLTAVSITKSIIMSSPIYLHAATV